jgi:pimeloyl-ACP methyl ester carboxylesterase
MPTSANDPTALDPRMNFPQPAPATSRFVTVDGVRLHLLDYGSDPGADRDSGDARPVLLCVHGSAANAHWFDFVATDLRADYRVLSLDQRGHGDSAWAADADYSYARYALDLAAVVEELGCDDITLVGHSMGGMVSLSYAATAPARVGKLVIVDSTMKLSAERVSMLRGVGDRPGRSYDSRAAYVENYRLRPAGATEMPDTVRHLAATGCRQFDDGQWRNKFDRKVYATRVGIEGLSYWDDIKIPSLYIKGALSDRMNDEVAAEIQARCPQLEFAEVPAANHHVTLDNPLGFNLALRHFLSKESTT